MTKHNIDYSNTILYKIVCNNLDIKHTYIGHTIQFTKRKWRHKNACNNISHRHHNLKVYDIIRENGGWDNWSMIEIEKYPCNDKHEAISRERYWYENLNGNLNTNYPGRVRKEYDWERQQSEEYKFNERIQYRKNITRIRKQQQKYYKKYQEVVKSKSLKYYEEHKEDMLKTIECGCGSTYSKVNKSKHFRTKRHQHYLKSTIDI